MIAGFAYEPVRVHGIDRKDEVQQENHTKKLSIIANG